MLKAIQRKIGTDTNTDIKELYKQPVKDKGKEVPSFKKGGAEAKQIAQCDILFMPMDKGFKYCLVVADVISGATDAEPLKEKTAAATHKAFQKIFARDYVKMPKYQMQMDQGTEFKNAVIEKYFHDAGVTIKWGKVDRSRNQAVVEARNKVIAQALFQKQVTKELVNKKVNRKWVDELPDVISALNEYEKGAYEKRAEKDKKLTNEPYIPEGTILLPVGTKVRIKLDAPVTAYDSKRIVGSKTFRATDIKWSTKTYTITNILLTPNQPILYQVDNEKTGYTYNQLQVVS